MRSAREPIWRNVSVRAGIPVLCHVAEERFADHLRDLRETCVPNHHKNEKAVGALTHRQRGKGGPYPS